MLGIRYANVNEVGHCSSAGKVSTYTKGIPGIVQDLKNNNNRELRYLKKLRAKIDME